MPLRRSIEGVESTKAEDTGEWAIASDESKKIGGIPGERYAAE